MFVVLALVIVVGWSFLRPKGAGLLVESSPASEVFVNGNSIGHTPIDTTIKAGEITIKLAPQSVGNSPKVIYETKITLVSGVKTVFRRILGESRDLSGGEVVSFEKTTPNDISIAVVTNPDSSEIRLDGETKGYAPIKLTNQISGVHKLQVSANGYQERSFDINAIERYKLTALVDLVKLPSVKPIPQAQASSSAEIRGAMIEILSTPTGFLRVRLLPTVASDEIAKVEPGRSFKLLETNIPEGWFKIDLGDGRSGWISDEYATTSAQTQP